jgi:hypothetical protein
MPGWADKLNILYEVSEPNLVRRLEQKDLIRPHEASGLCLGLCFNWFVQRLQNVDRPLPQLGMKRVYFAQALGNLQAWAAKGHVPTGRAFSNISMPDEQLSDFFNKVRKPVVPDQQYRPEVHIYSSEHFHHVSQDLGRARDELGVVDEDWYGQHVMRPALESYRSKLKDTSQHYGFLTPLLPGGVACVGRREGSFTGGSWQGFTDEDFQMRLVNRLAYSLDPHKSVRGAFMTLYKNYLSDAAEVGRLAGVDPMSRTVCAVIGWLGAHDGGAHAVALSYRGDIQGEVRFFDPNMGDFFFSTWTEFRTWHSVVFPACYGSRQYSRWDLELYARPIA